MSVLFVISRVQETSTAFDIAARIAKNGHDSLFLFVNDGCRHVTDPELVSKISYAQGVHYLAQDYMPEFIRCHSVEDVKPVSYSGWVELLEFCDSVVSWS